MRKTMTVLVLLGAACASKRPETTLAPAVDCNIDFEDPRRSSLKDGDTVRFTTVEGPRALDLAGWRRLNGRWTAGGLGEPQRITTHAGGVLPGHGALVVVGPGETAIAFVTKDALVPEDTNGDFDVYLKRSGAVRLVSAGVSGHTEKGASGEPAVASDGCTVVFSSYAALVPEAQPGVQNVYLRNLCSVGERPPLILLSRAIAGAAASADSYQPKISRDGRCAVFATEDTTILGAPASKYSNVVLAELGPRGVTALHGLTTRKSGEVWLPVDGPNAQPEIANDCSAVVFTSGAPSISAAIKDRDRPHIILVPDWKSPSFVDLTPVANGASRHPSVARAETGFVVAFSSLASNLVGDDTNEAEDAGDRDLFPDGVGRIARLGSARLEDRGHPRAALRAEGAQLRAGDQRELRQEGRVRRLHVGSVERRPARALPGGPSRRRVARRSRRRREPHGRHQRSPRRLRRDGEVRSLRRQHPPAQLQRQRAIFASDARNLSPPVGWTTTSHRRFTIWNKSGLVRAEERFWPEVQTVDGNDAPDLFLQDGRGCSASINGNPTPGEPAIDCMAPSALVF